MYILFIPRDMRSELNIHPRRKKSGRCRFYVMRIIITWEIKNSSTFHRLRNEPRWDQLRDKKGDCLPNASSGDDRRMADQDSFIYIHAYNNNKKLLLFQTKPVVLLFEMPRNWFLCSSCGLCRALCEECADWCWVEWICLLQKCGFILKKCPGFGKVGKSQCELLVLGYLAATSTMDTFASYFLCVG